MIDSHQHFWNYDPVRDSWITEDMKVIQRDFAPANLENTLKENNIDGCVSVQADQFEQETNFLLGLANNHDFIKGIVGWVDLKSIDIHDKLSFYSNYKKLKGFRHVVQGEPAGFLLQKDFLRGIDSLQDFNYTYDILIYTRQLEEAFEFVNQFPNQKFVLDHIAKPSIKEGEFEVWAKNISNLAKLENVYCKLSGMVTEADWKNWKPEIFKPYLDYAFNVFGSNRLMYGSDWPVCLVAASYKEQLSIVENFIASLSDSEKEAVMGGNAIRFYNL